MLKYIILFTIFCKSSVIFIIFFNLNELPRKYFASQAVCIGIVWGYGLSTPVTLIEI